MRQRLAVSAITLDFGNTLGRVDRQGLRAVVEDAADRLLQGTIIGDREAFLTA